MDSREVVEGAWPNHAGEMARLVRDHAWQDTPLGPPTHWPEALRVIVDTLLRSPIAMNLRWGEQGIQIYNDAYRAIIGEAHPGPFARSQETWPDIAGFIAEAVARARTGDAPFYRDIALKLGTTAPRYFDISYSPVTDAGSVGGVLAMLVETTDRVAAMARAAEAERRAEQSAARFLAALESTTDCVALLDPSWTFTFVNGRAVEQVSRGQDLVGLNHWAAFPETRGTEVETAYRRVMQERVAQEFRTFFAPLSAWFHVNAFPTADGGVALFFRNVTREELDREQRDLLVSRLEIALRAGDLGVWEWELATGRMNYSDRAKAICGFALDAEVTIDMAVGVTHPDDYPTTSEIAKRALDPAIRSREPYEYRIVRASDGAVRWVVAHGEALFSEDGQRALSYVGTLQDVTERKLDEAAVLESETRLRLAIDAGRMAVWSFDAQAETLQGSPELNRILGFGPDDRPSREEMEEGYLPGEQERVRAAGQEALARGDGFFEVEYQYRRRDGRVRWLHMRAEIILDGTGKPERVVGVVLDVTERREAEEQQRILAGELAHRVKNMLAVVQSIASMSFRRAADPREAQAAFAGRLTALAKSHDLLTSNSWQGAPIDETVRSALAPFAAMLDRIVAAGPKLMLPPTQATSLALVMHELAVNALKHGALSNDMGRVSVSWTMAGGLVTLRWEESGGPPVRPPTTQGFGSRLIHRGLSHERPSVLDYRPEGFTCELYINLDQAGSSAA